MKKLIHISLLMIGCLVISGCQKVERGCMNSYATNYNPDAMEDDGSCQYEACLTNNTGEVEFRNLNTWSDDIYDVYWDGVMIATIHPASFPNAYWHKITVPANNNLQHLAEFKLTGTSTLRCTQNVIIYICADLDCDCGS